MARHGASAILMMSPCVMAQTVPIPGWEIGLAAGSGSIALLLFIYATYLYRRDRRERADIESGNTALTARTTGNSGAGSSVGKAAGTGIRAAAGTGGKAAGRAGPAKGGRRDLFPVPRTRRGRGGLFSPVLHAAPPKP